MNDIEQKRAYLVRLYGGTRRWRRQVAKMSEAQVTAIYLKEHRRARPEHAENTGQELLDISVHALKAPRNPHENEDEFPIV